MTMTTNNDATRWKDVVGIYPPVEEIVVALQDHGTKGPGKKNGKEVQKQRWPKLEKLAAKLYANIQKEINPVGLTKNVSRGKQPLVKEIVLSRRSVDICETATFFHPHGKDGKIYLITNHESHCGLDVAINNFQNYIEQAVAQKNSARTLHDGLRLGCVLLDPKYRGSVSGIMTKKKGRKESDVTGDPVTSFFKVILDECFLNTEYLVNPPADVYYGEFPEEEKGSWDPNDASVFEHERDAHWLRSTWEDYVRPKYKKALDKWNKDTGGGDGTPTSFIDFCGGDRWLVYLFCKDLQVNFLLANSAAGRMPRHLQVESGFEEQDMSSLGEETGSSNNTSRKTALEDEVAEGRKQRQKMSETVEELADLIRGKRKENPMDEYIRQVADYSQMLNDSQVLQTMSPQSRELYLNSIKKQRKDALDKMKDRNSS